MFLALSIIGLAGGVACESGGIFRKVYWWVILCQFSWSSSGLPILDSSDNFKFLLSTENKKIKPLLSIF